MNSGDCYGIHCRGSVSSYSGTHYFAVVDTCYRDCHSSMHAEHLSLHPRANFHHEVRYHCRELVIGPSPGYVAPPAGTWTVAAAVIITSSLRTDGLPCTSTFHTLDIPSTDDRRNGTLRFDVPKYCRRKLQLLAKAWLGCYVNAGLHVFIHKAFHSLRMLDYTVLNNTHSGHYSVFSIAILYYAVFSYGIQYSVTLIQRVQYCSYKK